MSVLIKRQSNFELLRILAMMMVVMHHLVFHSGILEANCSFEHSILMRILGAWGKTAINVFVLITGYFMCEQSLSRKRMFKLAFPMFFYPIVLTLVLAFMSQDFSMRKMAGAFVWPLRHAGSTFPASFLWFYCFIPCYNAVIERMSRNQLRWFTLLGLCVYVLPATFFGNDNIFNPLPWYVVLYFLGAVLRSSQLNWMRSLRVSLSGLMVSFSISVISIVGFSTLHLDGVRWDFMLFDCNKLMAVLCAVFLFLTFQNIRFGYNRIVNAIASTVFGVYLIHDYGPAMHQLLWHDLLGVWAFPECPPVIMCGKMFLAALVVFGVCSVIDFVRLCLLKKLCPWERRNG